MLNYGGKMLSKCCFIVTSVWILLTMNCRIQFTSQNELCRGQFLWSIHQSFWENLKNHNAKNKAMHKIHTVLDVKGTNYYTAKNSRCSCVQLCSWLIEAFMQMKSALSFHLVLQMGESGWKEHQLLQVH